MIHHRMKRSLSSCGSTLAHQWDKVLNVGQPARHHLSKTEVTQAAGHEPLHSISASVRWLLPVLKSVLWPRHLTLLLPLGMQRCLCDTAPLFTPSDLYLLSSFSRGNPSPVVVTKEVDRTADYRLTHSLTHSHTDRKISLWLQTHKQN